MKGKDYKFQAPKNMYPPAVKYAECFYWQQGICKFPADECMYAHYPIRNSDRPETPPDRRTKFASPEDRKDDPPASKQFECYFWRRDGYCKFTEDDCLYAHHPTGKVKEGPGAYRALGSVKAIETPEKPSEPKQVPLSPKRKLTQNNQDAKATGIKYTMPKPNSLKLSELTLSAFFDHFCYFNSTARQDEPWETVLAFYKQFVIENFGKDNIKHIISAVARVCFLHICSFRGICSHAHRQNFQSLMR